MYVPKLEISGASRHKSIAGLMSSFYKTQKDVLLSGINTDALPYFAKSCLKRFFEVTEGEVRSALYEGDPWFFLRWRARLAQVDNAMATEGLQVTERWSLVNAQQMLHMMQLIANKRLVALGGVSTMTEEDAEATTTPVSNG